MDDKKSQQYDLFNNPMIDAARKAMTPEQVEEYKQMGEYMYNSINYRVAEVGSKIKQPEDEDLIIYASQALNSGLDPRDLSQEELRALIKVYGQKWYEQFDFEEGDVPKPIIELVTEEDARAEMERQARTLNLSRQERRARERINKKDQKRAKK